MNRHIELIKSSHAFEEIARDCSDKHLKHAYVFESADFTALETLAALLVCLAEEGEVRDFTLKRIFDGGYLDIVRLPRAEKNGKMDVEDATYLTDTAYLMPTELSSKYYIISPSEPLSEAVQNKMLKTLEEPPEASRFIIFSSGNDLLPTVTSRCGKIRLEEFSAERIESELIREGCDEVTAEISAAASRGNIGFAEKIASGDGGKRAFETAMNYLLNVKRSPQILPAASAMIADKDNLPAIIDYFEIILRDIMAFSVSGAEAVVLKPAVSDIIKLSREFDVNTCFNLMPLLTRARERIRLYGNASSIIDELLFSILEVKSKCLK